MKPNEKAKKAALIKQQLDEANARKNKVFKWIKFGVQLWALRMGFCFVGMCFPFFMNFYFEMFPNVIVYTSSVVSVNWFDVIKSDFKMISNIRNEGVPVKLFDIPLISNLALRLAFQKILPISSMQAKISKDSVYTHFSADRLWSPKLLATRNYSYVPLREFLSSSYQAEHVFEAYSHLDQLREVQDVDTCVEGECDSGARNKEYMYTMFTPLNSYIPNLVPSLTHFYYSQSSDAQVSLWISSLNASAALHYDMEDNFLLQIAGNKSVVLASPETFEFVRLHSSLHPYWRQSQLGQHLISAKSIYDLVHSFSPDNSSVSPMIWELQLKPGDMIYIPAGYFHAVTAGADSLSVNSWFSSTVSEVYASMLNTQLPFEAYEDKSTKIVNIATLIKKMAKRRLIPSFDKFSNNLRSRFQDLEDAMNCSTEEFLLCSQNELLISGTSKRIDRVVGNLQALFSQSRLAEALTQMLLLDYVEEILQLVVPGPELTPCFMLSFVDQCVNSKQT